MMTRYLSILLPFLVLLFGSSCSHTVTQQEFDKFVAIHEGKELDQLLREFKQKYEFQCLPGGVYKECEAEILEVNNDGFIGRWGHYETQYRFNRRPSIFSSDSLRLDQGDKMIFFAANDTILDIYGYLATIYELKKQARQNEIAGGTTSVHKSNNKKQVISNSKITVSIDHFGSFNALIIANSNYLSLPDLKTPKADAQDLEEILTKRYGFNVTKLIDATRGDVITALHQYRKSLNENDNLLIFYAGHGWLDQEADEGYWLPIDADRDNPMEWISNSSITATLKAMKAKHVAVISDSCYSGKLTRGLEMGATGDMSNIVARKARIVISSGGLEPVLDIGGAGGHSVFAAALLDTLSSNSEPIDTALLFSQIRSKVSWNADQAPELGIIHKAGHEGGDFFFIPKE